MNVFIVTQEGVYRHAIMGLRSSEESALELARVSALAECDDYHSFAPTKQAHLAYENARRMFFDGPVTGPPPPEPVRFATVSEELEYVTATLTGAGVGHILVADISPRAGYEVNSVKVIIPTLELWFCPQYRPSPFLAARAEQTVARMGATL